MFIFYTAGFKIKQTPPQILLLGGLAGTQWLLQSTLNLTTATQSTIFFVRSLSLSMSLRMFFFLQRNSRRGHALVSPKKTYSYLRPMKFGHQVEQLQKVENTSSSFHIRTQTLCLCQRALTVLHLQSWLALLLRSDPS